MFLTVTHRCNVTMTCHVSTSDVCLSSVLVVENTAIDTTKVWPKFWSEVLKFGKL